MEKESLAGTAQPAEVSVQKNVFQAWPFLQRRLPGIAQTRMLQLEAQRHCAWQWLLPGVSKAINHHKPKRTQSDTIGHNKNMWERNGTNELGIPLLTLELLPGCNFRQHAPVPVAIRSAVKEETRDMGSSEHRLPDFSLVV